MSSTSESPQAADGSVAVIGAGIAGLVVAHELERLGISTTVYEADARCGGRIRTHSFVTLDGSVTTVDLGAMRIPAEHSHTLAIVEQLGLRRELRPFHSILCLENNLVRIGSDFIPVREATPRLARAMTERLPDHPASSATAVFGGWFRAVVDAIAPAELRTTAWHDLPDVMRAADRVDLRPFLRERGIDLRGVLLTHPAITEACSPRLRSFVQDIMTEYNDQMYRLNGGMSRLIEELLRRIRGPVHLRRAVRRIDVRADEVSLAFNGPDGRGTRHHARVVCTVPFSVLRTMTLTGIDADKVAVIRDLDYGSATKVAFHTRRPFWRDRGIDGGASAPGGLIRQTYYPDAERDTSAALLGSYTIAEDADVLGSMPELHRHAVVRRELAAMHPEIEEPGMVLDTVSMAWGEHPWNRGCAARRWSADDAGRRVEARRAARAQHRLHFAGEHCSRNPAWVDSAIESAHRVLDEVLVTYRSGSADPLRRESV
jgi:monoamine oxidase